MIATLDQMVDKVLSLKKKYRVAVACANDNNTIFAINKAVSDGFAEAVLIGNSDRIITTCNKAGIDHSRFSIISSENDTDSVLLAVEMVRNGAADILMKGLVGTDIFLKAIIDKEKGLMLPDSVLSYVCTVEIPSYYKLLFITDPAVIPFPDLAQKIAMIKYSIQMAAKFGINKPKIALISASEKKSHHFQSSTDYQVMCEMAERGEFNDCVIDGPLDLFLACDKKSPEMKNVKTPVNGDADILLFPSIESCNPFYKALMLFANGELAGLLRGTVKPVVLMSRSESEKSKYYCIALACLMA